MIDNAIGHGYYKVSCEEYKIDADNFQTILNSFDIEEDLIKFLEQNGIDFELINKASNENYIILGSTGVLFDDSGKIIGEERK
jgi:hypothetical protein